MIIEESDYTLQSFIRDKEFMDSFLKMLIDEERALLALRYDRRRRRSWVQVAKMLNKSERQCYRDLDQIKDTYRNSLFYGDCG